MVAQYGFLNSSSLFSIEIVAELKFFKYPY
jgi:hypothetical protein